MVAKRFILLLTILLLIPGVFAADPGHSAASIEAGTFEAGNFVFPNMLTVTQNLIVDTDTLYVDSTNDYVGIGTTSPTTPLEVDGSINISNTTARLYAPEICLNGDCQTAWPAGGDVNGNGASVDRSVPRWNGTSGTYLEGSGMTIDDSDNVNITGVGTHYISGTIDPTNIAAFILTGAITGNDQDINDLNTLQANTIEDPEDSTLDISDDVDISGNLAIGSSGSIDTSRLLDIDATMTTPAEDHYGIRLEPTFSYTLGDNQADRGLYLVAEYNTVDENGSNADLYGVHSIARVRNGSTADDVYGIYGHADARHQVGQVNDIFGVYALANNNENGTVNTMHGIWATGSNDNGTVTGLYGGRLSAYTQLTGAVATSAYGLRTEVYENGGSIGTGYGLHSSCEDATTCYVAYLEATDTAPSTMYGLYQTGGGAINFFEGTVGIGTNSPTTPLEVDGSINISNATGKLHTPEICLNGDCQTAWPTGGDVTGNGASVDRSVPRWNGTSGTYLEGSGMTIDDSNNVNITGSGTHYIAGTIDPTNIAGFTLTGTITGNDQTINDIDTIQVNTILDPEDSTLLVNDGIEIDGDVRVDSSTGAVTTLLRDDSTTTEDELLGELLFESIDGSLSTVGASAAIRAYAAEDHASTDKGAYLTISLKDIDTDGSESDSRRAYLDEYGLDLNGTFYSTRSVVGNLIQDPFFLDTTYWDASGFVGEVLVTNLESNHKIRAMNITSTGNRQVRNDWLPVNPYKTYRFSIKVLSNDTAGSRYWGPRIANASGDVQQLISSTGATSESYYFANNVDLKANNEWETWVGYLLPCDYGDWTFNPSDAYGVYRMNCSTTQVQTRFLNWNTGGTNVSNLIAAPTIEEVNLMTNYGEHDDGFMVMGDFYVGRANDDVRIQIQDSNIANTFTDIGDDGVHTVIQNSQASSGGTSIYGLADGTFDGITRLIGYHVADPTDTHAAVQLIGGVSSGTGATNMADDETVLTVLDYDEVLMTVLGDGRVGIGTATLNTLLTIDGSVNISNTTAKLHVPEICLNGDCQTAWPSGGGGSSLWTNVSNNATYVAGNVGVGTTTPKEPLHVLTDGGGYGIMIEENTGDQNWTIGVDSSGDLNFFEEDQFRVTFEDGGNIGIGEANPDVELHIVGATATQANPATLTVATADTSTNADARIITKQGSDGTCCTGGFMLHAGVDSRTDNFTANDMYFMGMGSTDVHFGMERDGVVYFETDLDGEGDGIFVWRETRSEIMRLDQDGNLGIGATSPDHTLHVEGDVNLSNSDGAGIEISGSGKVVIKIG